MMAKNSIEIAIELVRDILERAEHEAAWLKRAGEKQGNYLVIAKVAKQAIKELSKVQS